MRHRRFSPLLALALLLALLPLGAAPAAALPADFVDELVAQIDGPTAVAFTPDGRMLVTTQGGRLFIVDEGTPPSLALDIGARICADFERGLLGVAVDPGFGQAQAGSGDIYLFFTRRVGTDSCPDSTDEVNQVSRFTLNGNTVDEASETVIVGGMRSFNGNHNAGDVQFAPDGTLFVTIGDGGCDYAGGGCSGANDATRDTHELLGKVLRVTRDGGVPGDNPYASDPAADACAATGRTAPGRLCKETFASGFRNPFRLAFDPDAPATRFFVNDVGQNAREEVDDGVPGADYGWNFCEGSVDNPGRPGTATCGSPYTPPIHDYSHSTGCSSITGGAFVPDGIWPPAYDAMYLYSDFVCGSIFALTPNGSGGYDRSTFTTGLGGAVHLVFGPAGESRALYYTTYDNGGEVRRIRYTGQVNRPPTAAVTASPTSGPAPLDVDFDASASSDPDGDILRFEWDFGDGSAPVQTGAPTVSHTYRAPGTYQARVVALDAAGARSAPVSVRLDPGNDAPEVTILSPEPGQRFAVGEQLVLRASATDAQDGELPDGAFSWTVLRHHDEHNHPNLPPTTGSQVTLTAPPPEDPPAVTTSYLEGSLTVTDSAGVTTTVPFRVDPRRVDLQIESDPAGLDLLVSGTTVRTPATIPSWEGWDLGLDAPDQVGGDGRSYVFNSWSDGGARSHVVTTPPQPATYQARFTGGDGPSVLRVGGEDRIGTAVALSQSRFSAGTGQGPLAETVVLARADGYPDALAGGPLAANANAPVLLTDTAALHPAVAQEITRLGAERAVLLGGGAALSATIERDLEAQGLDVERLAGLDRFETARLIAGELPESQEAYVVEGSDPDPARGWPDAVSAGWLAARRGVPILLVPSDSLPDATRLALDERGVQQATIVGGTVAVSEDVQEAIENQGVATVRIAGPTRYDTSRAVAAAAAVEGESKIYLATGRSFPDALTAGPVVAGEPLGLFLLVDGRALNGSPATAAELSDRAVTLRGVVLVGGLAAITAEVEAEIRAAIGG